MRRAVHGVVRLALAAAVLAAACLAITEPDGGPHGPRPVLAQATAALKHSNSRDGRAVLVAGNLRPGEGRSGTVTIANEGYRGALYLVRSVARDVERPGGRPLSERLRVRIAEELPRARAVADGPLGAAPACYPLGVFEHGESRTYRLAVAFGSGARGSSNPYAGASTSVDFEWLTTAVARDTCPAAAEHSVDLPAPAAPGAPATLPSHSGPPPLRLGDLRVAIEPGPYRFASRRGTARVGVRCLAAGAGLCRGRIELERRRRGQGRGLALAVGRFDVAVGRRQRVTLRLNARARRRIAGVRAMPVRAHVVARDSSGRRHRVAYRDRLVYRGR